ncbi:MAG: GspE/PulE/PilB domain-containing protein [Fimbriimonadaceae bacterium]
MKPDSYRRLGELLVAHAVISERQLQVALAQQRASKRKLGDLLVERGIADEKSIAKCLAEQYRHPLIDLDAITVDPSMAAALSPEHAVSLRALPFGRTQDGIAVAISDPVDLAATDQLYFLLRTRLELYVAPVGTLLRHIRFAYGLSDESPKLLAPEATKAPRRFARIRLRLRFSDAALFDAYDALLDRRVSLICRRAAPSSPEMTEIVRAAAATCDPGIVGVHDQCTEGGYTWTITEPLPVSNLGRVLRVQGPRSVAASADIVASVSEAMDVMGAGGRNHAWVCPDNVFLSDSGPVLAPIVAPPGGYRVDAEGDYPTGRQAVHALGSMLESCLLRPYTTDEETLPFQMHEILFRALGTDENNLYEAPIELAEALRSYNWTALTRPGATTTMEERAQLLEAMETEEEVEPKRTFLDWLFGRRAA